MYIYCDDHIPTRGAALLRIALQTQNIKWCRLDRNEISTEELLVKYEILKPLLDLLLYLIFSANNEFLVYFVGGTPVVSTHVSLTNAHSTLQ